MGFVKRWVERKRAEADAEWVKLAISVRPHEGCTSWNMNTGECNPARCSSHGVGSHDEEG